MFDVKILIGLALITISSNVIASALSIKDGKALLKSNVSIVNAWSKNKSAKPKANITHSDDVVFVSNTIFINEDEIFDGDGKLYVWVGEGNCGQAESMPEMFNMKNGSTLTNLYMAYAPDGIHIRGGNVTISNIINLEVCEDAVSTRVSPKKGNEAHNILIENSTFLNCADKGLQFNHGENITIRNVNLFACKQPIRIPKPIKNYTAENVRTSGESSKYYLRTKKYTEYHKKNGIK